MDIGLVANILTVAVSAIAVVGALVALVRFIQRRQARFSPEAEVARKLFVFFGDRRVLLSGPEGTPEPGYATDSILSIRARIGADLEAIKPKTPLAESLSTLQQACRRCLDVMNRIKGEREDLSGGLDSLLLTGIKTVAAEDALRTEFDKEITRISAIYKIPIPQTLRRR